MAPNKWEASQRPLFVRTVWISGARHAILSQDDPARSKANADNNTIKRFKRIQTNKTYKNVKNQTEHQQSNPVEIAIDTNVHSTSDQLTERVCQWLENSGKVKLSPTTPYEGTLWETPKNEILNLNAGQLKLARKNVELNITCTPIGQHRNVIDNQTEIIKTRTSSPAFVQTFKSPKLKSIRNCSSGTRPQLHIFMPLVQAMQRSTTEARI